jgi:ferritin
MENKKLKVYFEKGCTNEGYLMDINYKCENMFREEELYHFCSVLYRLNDLSRERLYCMQDYMKDCCIPQSEVEAKQSLELECSSLTDYLKLYKEALDSCKKYINELASEFLNDKDHCSYSKCVDVLKLYLKSYSIIYGIEELLEKYGDSKLALELISYKLKENTLQ